jgi:Predicted secreted Zn-dependent protease
MSRLNLPTKYASAVAAMLAVGINPNAAIAQSLPAQSSSAFPAAPLPPAEPWQPVEQVKTYAIRGATGIDLYRSIGERGPAAGVQAIAHTSFKLTWTRDYRPQPDGSCVLAVAKPKLIITYTLPKAPSGLLPVVAEKWQRFISGVETHERVHGDQIVDMVRDIEAFSRGLTAADDPKCQKVRQKLQARLKEFSDERVRQSRQFDEVELTEGGAVHQLILSLVNSPDR